MQRERRLISAASILALVLVVAPVGAIDYQDAYGPDARGVAPSGGPLRNETAFEIELPGSIVWQTAPIIREGKVYVLTASSVVDDGNRGEFDFEGKTSRAIYEIDLATGLNRIVVPLEVDGFGMAADDEHFYVVARDGLQAYRIHDGKAMWLAPWAGTEVARGKMSGCAAPVLRADAIYLVCTAHVGKLGENCLGKMAAKIGRADGIARWVWYNVSLDSFGLPRMEESCMVGYHALSVIGEHVFVASPVWSARQGTDVTPYPNAVFQLRDADGGFVQVYNSSAAHRQAGMAGEVKTSNLDVDSIEHSLYYDYPPPTGTSDRVFMRMGELLSVNPKTGERVNLGDFEKDNWGREEGAGMVFDGRRLFFTAGSNLFSLDVGTRKLLGGGRAAQLQPYEYWEGDGLTLSRGILYAHSNLHVHDHTQVVTSAGTDANNTHTFWAFDAETGIEKWHRALPPSSLPNKDNNAAVPGNNGSTWTPYHRFSVGHGVFVAGSITGKVLVIGRTAASIQPVFGPLDLYPGLRENVTVDLSASKPGAFGPATEFKATWGDGTASEWQSSPVFSHAYELTGRHDATFELRNPRNQTSIEEILFCVACPDPSLADKLANLQNDANNRPLSSKDAPADGGPASDIWRILAAIGAAAVVLLLIPLATRRKQMLTMPRFRVESELGYGATSKVLLAHDTVLDRKVVLKQPLSPWLLEPHGREKFLREAQIIAKMNHPNVVGIHEVLAHEEPPMLVLEFVQKGSLKDRLKAEHKLVPRDAVRIALDVLAGLGHVHDHGIIHRDIKPGNILLADDGSAKLTDFNIAKPPADMTQTISTSALTRHAGSPSYMSPEQTTGATLDPRSDLYSVAAVLYEMLAGSHYLGDATASERELAERIRSASPVLPHPDVPLRMAVFLEKALAKDASDRFPNADAMRRGLLDVVRRTKAPLGSR